MRLTIATLRRVVKGDLTIQFVPQALTSYGGLELLGRYLRRIDLGARLRQTFAGLRSDYGSPRIALVLLALVLRRGSAPRAPALPERRSDGDALLWLGPVAHPPDGRRLVAAVHAGDAGAARRLESGSRDRGVGATRAAPPDDRRGWVGHPDGAHRRLGLPRLQPASSEGPELLPAGRARGSDGTHPSPQEPARQRPRLQAGHPVPAGHHRRPPRSIRPARGPGVPHGCRLLPARDSAAA